MEERTRIDWPRRLRQTLLEAGVDDCGVLARQTLEAWMTPGAREKLEKQCPGWTGLACTVTSCCVSPEPQPEKARIARYARGQDYHTVVPALLQPGAALLQEHGFQARILVDASPVPEVTAAVLCGLGVRGRNTLLLTENWGSWVCIGCLVTDAPGDWPRGEPFRDCIGCGLCEENCPAHALSEGRLDPTRCLSARTQQNGELTPEEQSLLRAAGYAWGCDLCQEACPANREPRCTAQPAFLRDRLCALPPSILTLQSRRELTAQFPDRAFTWKGLRVLKRNLQVFF